MILKYFISHTKGADVRFLLSKQQQKDHISSLQVSSNKIQMGFNQYKCQEKLDSLKHTLGNMVSYPLIILFFIFHIFSIKKRNQSIAENVFLLNGIDESACPQLNEAIYLKNLTKKTIDLNFIKFVFKLIAKYPLHPYFVLKNLNRLSTINHVIKMIKPKAIFTHIEYSCTSSVVTEFCNCFGVKHNMFMHGEKLFTMRDSFCCFNEIYYYDQHYLKIFKELKWQYDRYHFFLPDSFRIKYKTDQSLDYTYYLAAESRSQMKIINTFLLKLVNKGKKVSVRAHPRWTDFNIVAEIFSNEIFIEKQNISIHESLAQTKNVISLFSTVLFIAYQNKINIVIDDCSHSGLYEKLIDLDYIFASKSINKLSEHVF